MYELALTGELAVSLQRYPYPSAGTVDALPRSCGALPIVAGRDGRWAAPNPAGEALWIGLVRAPGAGQACLARLVLGADHQPVEVPLIFAVAGVPRADGTSWALARTAPAPGAPACAGVELVVGSTEPIRIDFVDPAEYAKLSGTVLAPLDTGAAYGGWRLP